MTQSNNPTVTVNENVQPLHPGQSAVVEGKQGMMMAQGHSEMGGKALLAKKMAASGQSFYSPTDRMVSPCTAKLHLAKKKHFNKGKPLALSSSFVTSNHNPLQPHAQNVPLTNEGFLHPSHAAQAQFTLAHQGEGQKEQPTQQPQQAAEEDDEEMEM